MKFSAAATLAAIASLVAASPVQPPPQMSLDEWYLKVSLEIFPNNSNWEASFDAYIDPNVRASFNWVDYDFAGLKQLFTGYYSLISANYDFLVITPVDVVVLQNPDDMGGIMYSTGIEEGALKGNSTVRSERDALFAIVTEINGERKFTEWREVTNFI
jgi:hypothetical protein